MLDDILGDFFTNSSGHPGPSLGFVPSDAAKNSCTCTTRGSDMVAGGTDIRKHTKNGKQKLKKTKNKLKKTKQTNAVVSIHRFRAAKVVLHKSHSFWVTRSPFLTSLQGANFDPMGEVVPQG
jgi:hypothetical protein